MMVTIGTFNEVKKCRSFEIWSLQGFSLKIGSS